MVSPRTAVRLCGLASIGAGVFWTTGTLVNYTTGGRIAPTTTAGAATGLATHILMVFGFIGLYAGRPRSVGRLGLSSAALGIVGSTLLVGELAIAFARSTGAVEVLRPPLEIGAPATLSLLLGVVLMGVAALRTGAYTKWGGLLFVLAGVLALLQFLSQALAVIAIVSASIGFVWLGWQIWSSRETSVTSA